MEACSETIDVICRPIESLNQCKFGKGNIILTKRSISIRVYIHTYHIVQFMRIYIEDMVIVMITFLFQYKLART